MPRTNRITCVGCNKQMDENSQNGCTNNLFRLFLSARCLRNVSASDIACRKCRWKFGNWCRKTRDDFSDFMELNGVVKVMVSTSTFISDKCIIN